MENQTYHILAYNLPALEEEFTKLIKKAKKLNVAPPSYQVIKYVPSFVDRLTVPPEVMPARYEISVSGEFPKMSGWTFVGIIEHTEHGNVLRSIPSEEVPEELRTAKPTCDHCQTKRKRKDTFLVRNDHGELKRVGRSCIKDYLGGKSPEDIAYSATLLKALRDMEERECKSSGKSGYDVIEFLSFCVACVEYDGFYLSKTKAREQGGDPTSDKAIREMHKRDKDFKPTEDHVSEAISLLEWARNIEPSNSFEHNLKVVVQKDLLKSRDLGFIACVPTTYKKACGLLEKKKLIEEEIKDKIVNSDYFGKIGKREYFDLEFKYKVSFDGTFSRTHIYFFEDGEGNVALWKTSNPSPITINGFLDSFSKNVLYRIKATIKDHDIYRGIKQTILTRASVDPI